MALVLSRKRAEVILIGESIRVTVVQIKGNQVRLDVDAPRDIRVLRAELGSRDEAA